MHALGIVGVKTLRLEAKDPGEPKREEYAEQHITEPRMSKPLSTYNSMALGGNLKRRDSRFLDRRLRHIGGTRIRERGVASKEI